MADKPLLIAYNKTFPAKDFGFDDERRLQREFHDKHLKLRWNSFSRRCEVWYKSESQCYLVYEIVRPYNICRAIHFMKERERSRKDMFIEYLKNEDKYKEDKRKYIRDCAQEVAKSMENWVNGKIQVRV